MPTFLMFSVSNSCACTDGGTGSPLCTDGGSPGPFTTLPLHCWCPCAVWEPGVSSEGSPRPYAGEKHQRAAEL